MFQQQGPELRTVTVRFVLTITTHRDIGLAGEGRQQREKARRFTKARHSRSLEA